MSCILWWYHLLLSLYCFVCLVRPVNWHTGQQILVSDTICQFLSGDKEPWWHTHADLYSELAYVHLLHGRVVTCLYIIWETHPLMTNIVLSIFMAVCGHPWSYWISDCCVLLWILALVYWCANVSVPILFKTIGYTVQHVHVQVAPTFLSKSSRRLHGLQIK